LRRLAWDCATGNGQAARGLALHFARVLATDASPEQIEKSEGPPNVKFRVGRAESSGLAPQSADLVTAAQALHWFNAPEFFSEAQRVLVPGGAIAVWGYGDPVLDTPELQRILHAFNRGTIENHWLPERALLLAGYATIPFPFAEVAVPAFSLARDLSLAELMGYVRTWSATARFVAEHGTGELETLEAELRRNWGDPERARRVEAPMYIRAGHMPA
jgi:SAM-dependent methyltransferase